MLVNTTVRTCPGECLVEGDDITPKRWRVYCNAGNQPRMRAVAYDAEKGVLNFEFVDVTNLSAPTAYHTPDLEIRFVDKNHIVLEFTGMKNGETSASPVSLTRRSR